VTDDASDDGKWLTYQQLAEVRRISKPSAIRLVMRHRWRRQRDNERVVRVLVPPDMLEPDRAPHDASDDVSDDASQDTALAAGALAALETAVLALTERAQAAERRADRAFALAEGTMAQLAEANARADRAEGRVTAIQAGLEVARAEATRALAEAEALRQAEAARKARGLLARLRAAVRGRG
jgi:hypothetical protein